MDLLTRMAMEELTREPKIVPSDYYAIKEWYKKPWHKRLWGKKKFVQEHVKKQEARWAGQKISFPKRIEGTWKL